MAVRDFEFDGDPNGKLLGDQGDRCVHRSKNLTYLKTGGQSKTGWVVNITDPIPSQPGTIIQTQIAFIDVLKTTQALIPVDTDKKPLITQGDELLVGNIKPGWVNSRILLTFYAAWAYTVMHQDAVTFAMFRGTLTDAIASIQLGCPANTHLFPAFFQWLDSPATTLDVAYSIRFGRGAGSGTVSVNGPLAGRRGGGSMRAVLLMTEIKQ